MWHDEAEIDISDSLIAKIEEGMKLSPLHRRRLVEEVDRRALGKREFDVAMNREIAGGEVVMLPLRYEECELPEFLRGKLCAYFSKPEEYEAVRGKLLRRLRIS